MYWSATLAVTLLGYIVAASDNGQTQPSRNSFIIEYDLVRTNLPGAPLRSMESVQIPKYHHHHANTKARTRLPASARWPLTTAMTSKSSNLSVVMSSTVRASNLRLITWTLCSRFPA